MVDKKEQEAEEPTEDETCPICGRRLIDGFCQHDGFSSK